MHYTYHGDAVYNSGVTPVGITAPNDLNLRSFDVETSAFGNYTRQVFIKAFFPGVLTTTGNEIHGYSSRIEF
jgi:hypothetical protein